VLAGYYMLASFATLYLYAAIVHHIRLIQAKPSETPQINGSVGLTPPPSSRRRTIEGVLYTYPSFQDTAMPFSVLILIASLYTIATATAHQSEMTNLQIKFVLLTSVFIRCTATLLYTCGGDERRRTRLQKWTLALVFVLSAVCSLLSFAYPRYTLSSWEYLCSQTADLEYMRPLLPLPVIGAMNCILLYMIPSTLAKMNRQWGPYGLRATLYTTPLCGIIFALLMWTVLVYFTTERQRLVRASKSSKENQFTFGQILALGTWVPAVIDLVHFYCRKSRPVDSF